MVMTSCITQDYKSIIGTLIKNETDRAVVLAVVEAIPLCPSAVAGAKVPSIRKTPGLWADKEGKMIEPVYFNQEGKKSGFDSISQAARELTGKFSGTICDAEGKSCRASSAVEILTIKGFVVRDNGDAPVKGVSQQLIIYHPSSPQLKKLAGS